MGHVLLQVIQSALEKLLSGQLIDYVALLHDVEIRQIQVPESLNGKTVEEIELRQNFA